MTTRCIQLNFLDNTHIVLQGVQGEIDDPPGFMDLQRRRGADHEEHDRHNAYDKGPGLGGLSDVGLDGMNAGYDDLEHLRAGYKGMPGRFHTKLSLSLYVVFCLLPIKV